MRANVTRFVCVVLVATPLAASTGSFAQGPAADGLAGSYVEAQE